jgi:uncharacterized membrane protein
MAQEAAEDETMNDDDEMRDEHELDDDETREEDDDSGDDEQEASANGGSNGDSGIMEVLRSQIGEHKRMIATSAAAAAATYAAKRLPDLIDHLEQEGGDKMRDRLGKASDAGGVKGFAAGAASRAFSSGPGSLADRLMQGGEEEAKDKAKEKAKDSGGITGAVAKVADKVGGGKSQGGHGWGRGRRLPLLRSIDIAAPVETVYGQWTQFEELNSFMHRVEAVEQEEPETVVWHENIWGRRRHWKAQITEQIPNERIAWELKGGGQGTGVITFHELAPKLTRVEVVFDWQPQGIIEKLGSGLRVHKRAAKTDLYRFKAFVETRGEATGSWPGKIEDGEVKGQARNKRNTKADPIPSDAKQHSEEDEKKAQQKASGDEKKDAQKASGDQKGNGNGDENGDAEAEAAREERKRHREQRAKKQKEAA